MVETKKPRLLLDPDWRRVCVGCAGVQACVQTMDCRELRNHLPLKSVDLIATDPPHGDRIPYLELSELWNSLLGLHPQFERELVISNAKPRAKDKKLFCRQFPETLGGLADFLKPGGHFVLMFNCRDKDVWDAVWAGLTSGNYGQPLDYLGALPCEYSTGSVVQDNREGALKSDFLLFFRNPPENIVSANHDIQRQRGYIRDWPPISL